MNICDVAVEYRRTPMVSTSSTIAIITLPTSQFPNDYKELTVRFANLPGLFLSLVLATFRQF